MGTKESYEQKYTHPEFRERLKQEIKNSERGGESGQWSARKAQLLKQEYEKQGGGYLGGKDERQRSLTEWSQEEWQTREGEADARDHDETGRYLPKEAGQRMSREEAEATDRTKREASRQGRQFVDNTTPAKQARERSLAPPLADYDELSVKEVEEQAQSLSNEEVKRVREYERRHRNRKTLIETLNRQLPG